MSEKAPFEVIITDDNQIGIEISDEFTALPAEEQLKVMEAFFWEKTLESQKTGNVTQDMAKHEIMIVLAESMMAQLKRGEPFAKDGQVDITLDDLTNLWNILS